jgi:hypothetical protein
MIRKMYMEEIWKPSVKPTTRRYKPWGAFDWHLPDPAEQAPRWTESMGERLCIIDLDNRAWDGPNQLWANKVMNWDDEDHVHGLSLGVLNHWLYAKIHGYKYYYININEYEDRRTSWKKAPVMAEILKDHDTCIYLDSDAIFHHLDLPFEWLMNYWDIHPDTNSLALAYDPDSDNNKDMFGQVYLNTGFIIAQNNPRTWDIFKAWETCPDDNTIHADCRNFRLAAPGQPTDQGGFGTFIRYDYSDDIRSLPCTEANGFPESNSGCNGIFIKHLWTGKDSWIQVAVGEQLPGKYVSLFHEAFLQSKSEFYFTEDELMAGATHPSPAE